MCQEASGSFSTGIMVAARTSESRKVEPLSAAGNRLQSGLRSGTVTRSATHTAAPMNGKLSECSGNSRLTITLVTIAATRMSPTMKTRAQSTRVPVGSSFRIGEYFCCWNEAGMPKTTRATAAAT